MTTMDAIKPPLLYRNRLLKVALVTETFPPEINGVAMTLGRLTQGLLDNGHSVQLVRPRQHKEEVALANRRQRELLVGGLPIPRYPGLRFGLPAGRTMLNQWKSDRPDIVHVATQGPLGWSAINAARYLGLPVSSGFHTNFDAYSRHYGIGWLKPAIAGYLRSFHNRTDCTLAPTRALARNLTIDGYRNVSVLSRGVDTRLFNPTQRCQALRASWGVGPQDLVVTCIGRMAPEKNLGLVQAAFEAIKQVRPEARLLFVGDGPERAPLAQRHPEHLFAGMRRGDDLAAHYASADLFLFPSLTETFGNVTSEALASGLGVVGYAYAAAEELIEPGVNGMTAPPGDEAAFIRAAVALARDPDTLGGIRRAAAPSIAHLDWPRVHAAFIAALGGTISSHQRRQRAQDTLVVATD